MTTEQPLQFFDPTVEPFNYTVTENNTMAGFGNLSVENTSISDYINEPEEALQDYTEFVLAVWINKYYLYVICAIGIPGNAASLVTLTSMKPFSSYEVYMLMLTVSDIIVLISKMVYFQVTLNDIQIGNVSCKLMFFIGTMSLMYSNWTLVIITIERFIAIWFPFKVKNICTKMAAVIVNSILILILSCANWHFLLTYEEVADSFMVWDCKPRPQFANFIRFVWYWIDGILYAFLPIVLIVTLNCLIVYAVRQTARSRMDLTNSSRLSKEKASHQRQLTTMLLTVSIVFVVLVLPNCIFFIVKEYWSWRETVQGTAQYYLLLQVVFVLKDLNHAINFYLYCLSGGRFRQNFFRILCHLCRRGARAGSISNRATSDQRRPTTGDETSFTNVAQLSTPHELLQATSSNDSVLVDIMDKSEHI